MRYNNYTSLTPVILTKDTTSICFLNWSNYISRSQLTQITICWWSIWLIKAKLNHKIKTSHFTVFTHKLSPFFVNGISYLYNKEPKVVHTNRFKNKNYVSLAAHYENKKKFLQSSRENKNTPTDLQLSTETMLSVTATKEVIGTAMAQW